MTVRRGRDQVLDPTTYAPIQLATNPALTWPPGADLDDLRASLDPERVCEILGVTDGGRFETAHVAAFGEKLFTNHTLGVDLLVVPPRSGFPTHVHPGHHLLICLAGRGTFSLDRETKDVEPGFIAMVEGDVPHAVGNPYDTCHVLLAIGSPHKELDSEERMKVVDWDGQPLHVPV